MPSLQAGGKFGQFRLIKILGRGGMGEVWRAVDSDPSYEGPDVALKVLLAASDEAGVSIQREVQGLKRVGSHPGICGLVDSGCAGDTWWVAMEMLDGADLSEVLRRAGGPLPLERVRAIGADVLGGLAHIHARGVFHRDLKPANVRVTSSGRAKLMDLGIAKIRSMTRAVTIELDQASKRIGTPDYMAPEQWAGEADAEFGKVDGRTDLYSFGIMLFELLAGERPFRGSVQELLALHALTDPPSLRERAPDLPPAVEDLFKRLVAKKKEDRYATAEEALRALEAACAGSGSAARGARRPVAPSEAETVVPPVPTIDVPPPVPPGPPGPRPRVESPSERPTVLAGGPAFRFQLRYSIGGAPRVVNLAVGRRTVFGRSRKPETKAGETWADVPAFTLRYLPAADAAMAARSEGISKRHFEIELRDAAFVTDRSSGGTSLNGARLASGVAARLSDGDRLRVGGGPLELEVALFPRGGPAVEAVRLRRRGNGETHEYLIVAGSASIGTDADAAVQLDPEGGAWPSHALLAAHPSGLPSVHAHPDAGVFANGAPASSEPMLAAGTLRVGPCEILVEARAPDDDALLR